MKGNQLKAGVMLSYGSLVLSYGIAIVYTPVMIRLLGQSEYGLYNLVSSIVSYLGLLGFGFGSAYIRVYSRCRVMDDRQGIARLNGMFFLVFSIIGVVAVLAGSVLIFQVTAVFGEKLSAGELATAKLLMAMMTVNMALSFFATVFNLYIFANEEYIFQKMLQLIKTVLNPLLVIPVLLLGYKSAGLVLVTTGLTLAIEISNVVFCVKQLKMKLQFRELDFRVMKEVIIFSVYIFINMMIDQINWNAAQFILGVFYGTGAVAVYGLAVQISTYYVSLSTAISNSVIPRVNRIVALHTDNEELTRLLARVGRLQFIVLSLICSGLIFFGLPFITMWAGPEYADAYYILLLLVVPVTIPLIQNVGIEIQKAKNMHQFRSIVYLLIALGNVGLSILLGKWYGGIGCAIGTAVSLAVGNGLIMNWYYQERIGLDMKYYWQQIAACMPALLPPVLTGMLMVSWMDLYQVIPFLACGSLYAAVFCGSMWRWGMNDAEKALVGVPLAEFLSKQRGRIDKHEPS